MDEMFGLRFTADYLDESPVTAMPAVLDHQVLVWPATAAFRDRIPIFSASSAISDTASIQMSTGSDDEVFSTTRAKIAFHPLYPKLLEAYIDFQKVGAPSDIANLLDEIHQEKEICRRSAFSTCLGDDPELDEFMEAFCLVLAKCKSDLATPFNEANTFLNNMEIQLSNLCIGATRSSVTDEAVGSSEEEFSAGETDVKECYRPAREDQELKDKLLHRYSGYISSLKHGFSNNKKKVKLPKEAREILLDWWSIHHKWPYPTEIDKMALAESTGLEQKQINNWFINQRKRHWKPADHNMLSIYGSFFND